MLDRADKYNALDMPMFAALSEAADDIAKDQSARAVVLHAAGDNFCAGIDTGIFAEPGIDIGASMAPTGSSPANLYQRAAYAWRELPIPVICALQGITFGGGLQIAMGADLRFAAADATFSIMETKWGLIPDMAITTTLRHIVSPDRVKELAWSARVFDAAEALQFGLITAIHAEPLEAAMSAAEQYAARSPDAIQGIKRLVNEGWSSSEAEALALEARLQLGVMGQPNQVEAVRANMEKRAPRFND
ncbi:MAG: crotonase/enoyl-CoA hydratase family protein [Gammaproteobacteria bacterium]|nr:crotonase/enoyl-CoA hydratase family protein [Gammaproteobacteria bacterium]